MSPEADATYIAFDGDRRIASGGLREIARAAKGVLDRRKSASILVFDAMTSEPVDLDLRGSIAEIQARLPGFPGESAAAGESPPSAPRGPGRPKLGVVAREVTLLPRHWEWL